MAAIGDVDEANSAIGIARLHVRDEDHRAMIGRIQNEMFDLGADLATPGDEFGASGGNLRITEDQVRRLEQEIDAMNEGLEPLRSFILPGGGEAAAQMHMARTVVRRAERTAVAAGAAGIMLNPQALAYLNRLSDHLFVLARAIAKSEGGDVFWQPGATRRT